MSNEKIQTPPPPYYMTRPKNRWWVPVIITVVIIFAIIISFIAIISSGISSMFEEEPYYVENNSVLKIQFMGKLEERQPDNPFNIFGLKQNYTLSELLTSINRAENDDRIEGIYIKGGISAFGFAKALEIKDAIEEFKKSGKFVYAYMDWGAELDYFIALSADKIYMPPEGVIELNGFSISTMFYKDLFKKIGIDYFVLGFEDFKSAGEMFDRNNFSDSARYQYQVLLKQRFDYFVNETIKQRKIEKQKFLNALNRGIYSADSLYQLGLIDSLLFESDIKSLLKNKVFDLKATEQLQNNDSKNEQKEKIEDKDLKLVSIQNYYSDLPPVDKKKIVEGKEIAVIYASGPLTENFGNTLSNELQITTKEFVESLEKAREDENIKVIIIRVDSPGGAVITSDAIYNEIIKTRKVKPVYASMSDVAASGGYYISVACDTIIAHPATITGSIGVIMAIPNAAELMDNIYINVDTVASNPNATQFSGFYPLKNKDKSKLKGIAFNIYKRFLKKVADNRGMTFEQARAIAKGRVWTGEDAKKIGLVDVLGGFNKAIKIAKNRIGLDDDDKVYIRKFPEKKDDLQQILQIFGVKPPEDEEIRTDLNSEMSKYFGKQIKNSLPIYNNMPKNIKSQLSYMLTLLKISEKEKVMMAMPEYIEIE